jgi:hypothetical protein
MIEPAFCVALIEFLYRRLFQLQLTEENWRQLPFYCTGIMFQISSFNIIRMTTPPLLQTPLNPTQQILELR